MREEVTSVHKHMQVFFSQCCPACCAPMPFNTSKHQCARAISAEQSSIVRVDANTVRHSPTCNHSSRPCPTPLNSLQHAVVSWHSITTSIASQLMQCSPRTSYNLSTRLFHCQRIRWLPLMAQSSMASVIKLQPVPHSGWLLLQMSSLRGVVHLC